MLSLSRSDLGLLLLTAAMAGCGGDTPPEPLPAIDPPDAKTWSEPMLLYGTGADPTVGADEQGRAVAAWRTPEFGDGPYQMWIAHYQTGSGWQSAQSVVADAGFNAPPKLVLDESGRTLLLWSDGQRIWALLPDAPGASKYVLGSAANYVAPEGAGWDAHGNALVAWTEHNSSTSFVWVRRLSDATRWGNAVRLQATTAILGPVALGVGHGGQAVAVWEEFSFGVSDDVVGARYTPGTGWSAPEVLASYRLDSKLKAATPSTDRDCAVTAAGNRRPGRERDRDLGSSCDRVPRPDSACASRQWQGFLATRRDLGRRLAGRRNPCPWAGPRRARQRHCRLGPRDVWHGRDRKPSCGSVRTGRWMARAARAGPRCLADPSWTSVSVPGAAPWCYGCSPATLAASRSAQRGSFRRLAGSRRPWCGIAPRKGSSRPGRTCPWPKAAMPSPFGTSARRPPAPAPGAASCSSAMEAAPGAPG